MKRILFCGAKSVIEPLGLLHLAGLSRDMGWERQFHLIENEKYDELIDEVKRFKPDLVGFNIYTGNHRQTFFAIERIKKENPNIGIIVGGPHPTYFPVESSKVADFVVMSEGFLSLKKILSGEASKGILPMSSTMKFPLPDRKTLYTKYPEYARSHIKSVISMTGCPYRCTYCFTGDTLVHTTKGMLKIEDIVNNKIPVKVYTATGKVQEVSQFHKREVDTNLISINLHKLPIPINGTPNHKIFTNRGSIKLEDIIADDWIRIGIPDLSEVVPSIDPRLAGLYIAEGSISYSNRNSTLRFSFNKNETNYIEEISQKLYTRYNLPTRLVTQDSVTHVEMTRKHICTDLESMFGKGAVAKYLPEEVFAWSKENKIEFLKAWMDGDGYKKQSRIITVSPGLAIQGFLLAVSIGLKPSLFVREIPDSKIGDRVISTKNKMWTLAFDFNEDRILLGTPIQILKNKQPYNRDRYIKIDKDCVWIKIKSINIKPYTGNVFNLGVENEHSYTANGLSVSNCYNSSTPSDINLTPELAAQMSKTIGMGGRLFPFNIRTVSDVIHEVEEIKSNWDTKVVYFQDDVHGFDIKEWMPEFAKEWKEKIKIPYHAQMRWEMTKGESGNKRLELLKEAGCFGLTLAIEAANATIRDEVLDRKMDDALVFEGMTAVIGKGFRVRTEQISGLPYGATTKPTPINLEADIGLIKLSVDLQTKCKGPSMSWVSTLAPYIGTKLGAYCNKYGHYINTQNNDVPDTFFERSVLRFPKEWIGPSLEKMKNDSSVWLSDSELEKYRNQNAALRKYFHVFCLIPEGG